MRITATLGLVFVTAFAAPIFAAPAVGQSFVGKWTATADAPSGKVSETLTVVKTKDGYAITARLVGPVAEGQPEAGPGTDIVVNEDTFSYKRTVTIAGNTLVITYSGVVSGDTFAGTVDLGFAQVPYTGVRIKDGG